MAGRLVFLLSAAALRRLRGGRGTQPRLDAHRRDVQLATGSPPFVRYHRNRQQVAAPVRHHGGHTVTREQITIIIRGGGGFP